MLSHPCFINLHFQEGCQLDLVGLVVWWHSTWENSKLMLQPSMQKEEARSSPSLIHVLLHVLFSMQDKRLTREMPE